MRMMRILPSPGTEWPLSLAWECRGRRNLASAGAFKSVPGRGKRSRKDTVQALE